MIKNITPTIKYIGVDDTTLDLFESQYIIPNGISYNSYLILDEKVAVMDTVDRRKSEDWWANLEEALEGRTPNYLIVQHMEPDHAGNIVAALEKYPELKVVASKKAIAMLPQFFEGFDFTGRTIAVNEYEKLSLGAHSLQFIMAPMVHWPEVMVTYDHADKILFSADAFGKFGALCHDEEWDCEARRYYINICGKYGISVQSLLKKASELEIKSICPLHGPVLSENLEHYIGLYDIWSKYDVESEGVFVAYASIYGGTKVAALKLAEMLKEKGAKKVAVADLSREDMAEAVEDAFRYGQLVVAASSYDGDVFPPMYDFLHHLKLKAYQKRRVGIIENGSWAPSAGRVMKEMLGKMKEVEIVEPMVTIRSTMKQTDLPAMEALAEAMLK
ncbi:MAG: FprA family A-type flavoprotein [Muribaculaceae bacterium]|nr:FprA family A-type flavoprotein [Muribaculaceae bacterium]MBQ7853535.1 FprA family A-type flavoprotein [Muribaculaceae bacterium]MBR3830066.1 FprA family A-type flavoprotein [Muribaculaceae bacterium]